MMTEPPTADVVPCSNVRGSTSRSVPAASVPVTAMSSVPLRFSFAVLVLGASLTPLTVMVTVAAAELTVTKYGSDLGLTAEEQVLEVHAENELIWTDDTKANGIFTITPELIAANIETLAKAGIDTTAEALFDTSLIDEVYAENPDLKTPPV